MALPVLGLKFIRRIEMRSLITGIEMKKFEKSDDELELNTFTGTMQRKFTKAEKEGLEFDPITGGYIEKAESDKTLWPSLVGEEEIEKNEGDFEKFVPVFVVEKADKDEHIVMGIIYEPDTEDSQGDMASAEEIKKAAKTCRFCGHTM